MEIKKIMRNPQQRIILISGLVLSIATVVFSAAIPTYASNN